MKETEIQHLSSPVQINLKWNTHLNMPWDTRIRALGKHFKTDLGKGFLASTTKHGTLKQIMSNRTDLNPELLLIKGNNQQRDNLQGDKMFDKYFLIKYFWEYVRNQTIQQQKYKII